MLWLEKIHVHQSCLLMCINSSEDETARNLQNSITTDVLAKGGSCVTCNIASWIGGWSSGLLWLRWVVMATVDYYALSHLICTSVRTTKHFHGNTIHHDIANLLSDSTCCLRVFPSSTAASCFCDNWSILCWYSCSCWSLMMMSFSSVVTLLCSSSLSLANSCQTMCRTYRASQRAVTILH